MLTLLGILVVRTALVMRLIFWRMHKQKSEAGNDSLVLETNMPSHFVEKV